MIRSGIEDEDLVPGDGGRGGVDPPAHGRGRGAGSDENGGGDGADIESADIESADAGCPGAESADAESAGAESAGAAGGAAPVPEDLPGTIEAILFSTSEPITVRQLAEVLAVPIHDVREAVEDLRVELAGSGRAFCLDEIAGGLQLLTLPRFHAWVTRFHRARKAQRLSAAALETLSVIAYKQPISKAELERIRGVQCGPILKTLIDRGLVTIAGRDDAIGRPLLYGTTPRFLESFGLSSLKHLPQPEFDTLLADDAGS